MFVNILYDVSRVSGNWFKGCCYCETCRSRYGVCLITVAMSVLSHKGGGVPRVYSEKVIGVGTGRMREDEKSVTFGD